MIHRKKVISHFARLGYFSRAIIYITLGALGLMKVFTLGYKGQFTDSKGAIKALHDYTLGYNLMWILVLGLFGYVIWRFLQATIDADNHGKSFKGIIVRLSLFISAIAHSTLAYYTIKILTSVDDSSLSRSNKEIIIEIFNLPLGKLFISLFGFVLIGFSLSQIIKAYKEKYKKFMNFPKSYGILDLISKAGLSGRGLVFLIMGFIFIYAAFYGDFEHVDGIKDVWKFLSQFQYGHIFIALMATLLMSFGFYSFIESIYRKVDL